ncbi:MAG: hypothetical protein H0W10_00140 [Chloroflexi bacterium]|nr:hypothetical protein [Chloroflexota bacterium]
MSSFGVDGFGTVRTVTVDVYTSAHRISGTIQTRFNRVTEILNQLTGSHLAVEQAAISDHADPSGTISAPSALVTVDEILVMIVAGLDSQSSQEMRVPKRPARAQLALPPLRVTGTIHVAMGSRPIDGLLNVPDRFMAMTDATLSSGAYPELERSASVLALRRDRAHVLLVADDEHPDQLLTEVRADAETLEG